MDKWVNNEEIYLIYSNSFWENMEITDSQISQLLNFRFGQYMGNHLKTNFGLQDKHPINVHMSCPIHRYMATSTSHMSKRKHSQIKNRNTQQCSLGTTQNVHG